MPAKPLTDLQLTDAAALKTLFKTWQLRRKGEYLPFSQEWASEQMGFGQSAMNQYLNGKIPLNPEAASKFAVLMGVNIESFSPAISEEIVALAEGIETSGRFDANVSIGPEIRGRVPLISWVQAGAWCGAVDLLLPGEAEQLGPPVEVAALETLGQQVEAGPGDEGVEAEEGGPLLGR